MSLWHKKRRWEATATCVLKGKERKTNATHIRWAPARDWCVAMRCFMIRRQMSHSAEFMLWRWDGPRLSSADTHRMQRKGTPAGWMLSTDPSAHNPPETSSAERNGFFFTKCITFILFHFTLLQVRQFNVSQHSKLCRHNRYVHSMYGCTPSILANSYIYIYFHCPRNFKTILQKKWKEKEWKVFFFFFVFFFFLFFCLASILRAAVQQWNSSPAMHELMCRCTILY